MFYTIYKVTNKVNGKFYIGKHQTSNLDDGYMGSGILITKAIKKYGTEFFEKEILFIFDNEEEMNSKEIEIVDIDLIEDINCYNVGLGGQGGPLFKGRKHSEQTKTLLRQKSLGKCHTDITKQKISYSNMNRIVSEETRRLLSDKPVCHTDITKQKISNSMKIYYESGEVSVYERTDVIKEKTSKSMKQYHALKSEDEKKLSDDHKRKISASVKEKGIVNDNVRKKVVCPHCKKEGQELAMKRYHFDNCKKK